MIDRTIALFTTGPVGSAVAWSGWTRTRAGDVVGQRTGNLELLCETGLRTRAADVLSCGGPTNAAEGEVQQCECDELNHLKHF